ncbi:DUF2971 domain-containing protein [Edwardsiella tarda]|uniref:DUF2971 domain-containing protein n=1 Tax=Edwardsiella tarda TaxID=636 RepID=UPI00351C503D
MSNSQSENIKKEYDVTLPPILKKYGFSLKNHIFRYRPEDSKKNNTNYTTEEITHNKIWHSSVSLLNDPFELFFKRNTNEMDDISDDDLFFLWLHLLKNNQIKIYENSINEIDAKISFYINKEKIKLDISKAINLPVLDLINEIRERVCISCFTKACDSRLMWGYYCHGLAGLCLIYNKEKLKKNGLKLVKVEYSEERPIVNLCQHVVDFNRDKKVEFMERILISKHSEWEHEQEFRSMTFLFNDHADLKGKVELLDENCIDGIIIGNGCSNEMSIKKIKKYSKDNGIKLFKAKANLDDYIIEIDEEKD